jgi:hypothetical protein
MRRNSFRQHRLWKMREGTKTAAGHDRRWKDLKTLKQLPAVSGRQDNRLF